MHRPAPPAGARHWVLLVLDSCRYDTFVEAAPRRMSALGQIERRYSYATWTAPAHFNLLMGLLPHTGPTRTLASRVYGETFREHRHRLGVPEMSFARMLPSMWMPTTLRRGLGYATGARVSLPVLNPETPLSLDFDDYAQARAHNDLDALVADIRFDGGRPWFWLLNTGETHYPYAAAGRDAAPLPHLPGLHGVFRRLAAGTPLREEDMPDLFRPETLAALRERQVQAVRDVDAAVGRLMARLPRGTWLTITSDHGECFGEDGYFGHGPIPHAKVLEVPFVEGMVR
ncbi:MAG: sulfatase-like hydrolase/transferase [Myxococcota bacterium]|nr:sulfatase-like hydrolase/transferase [Myxococcota bacterium]